MRSKKLIFTAFFFLFFLYGYSAIQFYESVLNQGVVTKITPTSYISWGQVDIDFIQLNKIPAGNDGLIKFSIQPTEYVEVSLTKANNLNARFGFIFKTANHFTLQLDGVEEDIGTIGYNSADEFRVVKCGIYIRFYKNMDLLYEYCGNNTAEDLVHTTHVTNAVNTELSLIFDNNITDCNTLFLMNPNDDGLVMLVAPDTEVESNDVVVTENLQAENNSEQLVFPKNKIIIASVFNQEGGPVKQFRIRTTRYGMIPENHALFEYIRGNYRVEFKETKK